jgi:hypothetical protein
MHGKSMFGACFDAISQTLVHHSIAHIQSVCPVFQGVDNVDVVVLDHAKDTTLI